LRPFLRRQKSKIFMVTDPIADYLTRIRNAIGANHRIVEIPTSRMKKRNNQTFT